MVLTQWFIGSIRNMAAATYEISVNGAAATEYTIPQGSYYLFHSQTAYSLCDQVVADLTAEGATNADWHIDEKGHIHFTASETIELNFLASDLRYYLGWSTAVTDEATEIYGDRIPYLLWSPGAQGDTLAPRDKTGMPHEAIAMTRSANGRTTVATELDGGNPLTLQEWRWDYITKDRAWESDLGGEFKVFREHVLRNFYHFMVYNDIAENRNVSDASAADIAINTANALGPYAIEDLDHLLNWYDRRYEHLDLGIRLTLKGVLQTEYSS